MLQTNSVVLQVFAQDRDYELNWPMKYSIASDSGVENIFSIDETSGEIKVIGAIDREDNLGVSNRGSFEFEVIVS